MKINGEDYIMNWVTEFAFSFGQIRPTLDQKVLGGRLICRGDFPRLSHKLVFGSRIQHRMHASTKLSRSMVSHEFRPNVLGRTGCYSFATAESKNIGRSKENISPTGGAEAGSCAQIEI